MIHLASPYSQRDAAARETRARYLSILRRRLPGQHLVMPTPLLDLVVRRKTNRQDVNRHLLAEPRWRR